jgi:hypothetical protein
VELKTEEELKYQPKTPLATKKTMGMTTATKAKTPGTLLSHMPRKSDIEG